MSGGRGGGGRRYGNEEEQSRKLFVGGLSFDTTDDSLREYFERYGILTDCVVIKERNSTRSKGFGFVTYETEEEADKCMDSRPHQLQGRTVDVKRAVSREESSKPGAHVSVKKIFVGGLKENITEDILKGFFGQHGEIESCEIMREKGTEKSRGFGFITFTDFDSVDKLVAKRMYEVEGSKCEVKKALSRAEMDKAKSDADSRASRNNDYEGGRGGHGGYGNGMGHGGFGGYSGMGRGGGRGGYGGRGGHNGYESYGGFSGRGGGRGGGSGNYGGYSGYGGYGDGGGYGGGSYGGYENEGFGGSRYSGYDGYEGSGGGGYGGYGGQSDYGGYSSGYGGGGGGPGRGGGSSYGPVRGGSYSQRSSGPYGGGYGSGGGGQGYGGGSGYGGGRY